MNGVSAAVERARGGHIRIEFDRNLKRQGFHLDVACIGDEAYRVLLVECPISGQHLISLVRPQEREGADVTVVSQLFTYDLHRAFEVIGHLMVVDDPQGFCANLAQTFGGLEPNARIPLDGKPS